MRWRMKLLFLVLISIMFACSGEALIVHSTGPDIKKEAQVSITKIGSSETSGYYFYTIYNTGDTDLNLISFDLTYVVDLTPNITHDMKIETYPVTIAHSGKIPKGGRFSGRGDINLNMIDSKILTQDTITFKQTEIKRSISSNQSASVISSKNIMKNPPKPLDPPKPKPVIITKSYTAYSTDLIVTISNNSDQDINEMRLDVLVKSKTIQYFIKDSKLDSKNHQDASIIHSYTITGIPKKSTITKTYNNIQIELETLPEQEKEHIVYPVYEVKVIDKKILNPGSLYERLQDVTISSAISVE